MESWCWLPQLGDREGREGVACGRCQGTGSLKGVKNLLLPWEKEREMTSRQKAGCSSQQHPRMPQELF